MKRVDRAVAGLIGAGLKLLALVPVLAILVLGSARLPELAGDPAWRAGALRALWLAGAATALAWPAGVLAAMGLWGARPGARRWVIGMAVATLLLPPRITALGSPDYLPAVLAAHAAGAACIVLLVMTAALGGLDPRVIHSAAACGASPLRGWWVAAAPGLARPMMVSAAAALSFALGPSALDETLAASGKPTIGAMAAAAARSGRLEAAPGALILICLAIAPLLMVCLAELLRPAFTTNAAKPAERCDLA